MELYEKIVEPTLKNYCRILSIIDEELEKDNKGNEYIIIQYCECFINSFMSEVTIDKLIELLNKVRRSLSEEQMNQLVEYIFKINKKG